MADDDMQLDGPPSPEARAPASPPSPPGGDDVAGEFLSDEVVRTRLASMTAAEGDYAVVPHDYMTTVQRHGMTADWREKIYRWYGQLSESFALSETSVQCALNFLDRYLCATPRPRFDSHARARRMHHLARARAAARATRGVERFERRAYETLRLARRAFRGSVATRRTGGPRPRRRQVLHGRQLPAAERGLPLPRDQGRGLCANLQLDFYVSVFECFDTSTSAVLREPDESNRSVQKSAESTSM